MSSLLKLSKYLGIEKQTFFHGFLPHDAILKYYSLTDIFIGPSIETEIGEQEG
jgi:hypothetical protein